MKTIGSQIVRTVLDNSISIFLTITLFVSYIFILSGLPATLPNYLSTTALICLLYWPIMGFALFRKYLIKSFPNFVTTGIWLICFLIYPILLITSYKKIEISDTPFFEPVLEFGILRFLISAGLTFLLTEIVLQFHFYRRLWTNPRNWLEKEFHLTLRTLSSFEDQLDTSRFIRIHKSFMVNKSFIDYIEGNLIIMRNGQRLSVGKNFRSKLKDLIR